MLDVGVGVKSMILFWKVWVPPQQAPVETQMEMGSTTSASLTGIYTTFCDFGTHVLHSYMG